MSESKMLSEPDAFSKRGWMFGNELGNVLSGWSNNG